MQGSCPAGKIEGRGGVTDEYFPSTLLETLDRLRLATEGPGIGTYDLDLVRDEGVWAASTFDILGIAIPADMIGRSQDWRALVHPDDRAALDRQYQEALAASGPWRTQFRIRRANDGAERWISIFGQFLCEEGKPARSVGVVIDITDQKHAEAEAERARHRLERVSQATPSLIHIYDRDEHRTVWASGRIPEMMGFTIEEAMQRDHLFDPQTIPVEDLANIVRRHAALDRAPDGHVAETEFRVRQPDGRHRWLLDRTIVFERTQGGHIKQTLSAVIDITERKVGEERQGLLLNELNHRVKNTLAIIQSIAHQTFGYSDIAIERRTVFEERLAALSAAHDLLTAENWQSADIGDVIAEALAPHSGGVDRFTAAGPSVQLPPRIAVALALAFNELCTNAVKYGALSAPKGRVAILWRLEEKEQGARLILDWIESGGPVVKPPGRRGFGSRLIERALAAEIDGRVAMDFSPAGLTCHIEAALFG